MTDLTNTLKQILRDVVLFAYHASGLALRSYQEQVAYAIAESVTKRLGLTFVVIFPRQSGKNELQAHLETYLLALFSQHDAEIVKVSPTWKPQSLNAMRRLERVLQKNLIARTRWKKESGYIYRVGSARIFFLSGAPTSNVVGATASTLLECDEAQDVLISKWDKDILPMAASTNATRVFWGTAWTSKTLLARELRAARAAEAKDGIRRTFILTADQVAQEVPAYGAFVAGEVAKLGRNHPIVRTQFYSEEIDAESGMFPPRRLALMRGAHPRQTRPQPGKYYAFLVDVAGQDEAASLAPGGDPDPGSLANSARDSTCLTVVDVDLSTVADELIRKPTYRVVERRLWTGAAQTTQYAQLRSLVDTWQPRFLIIDATGVGAGLASFLDNVYPNLVIPFTFNSATKSMLAWIFLAIIETGRFQDWEENQGTGVEGGGEKEVLPPLPSPLSPDLLQPLFFQQLQACQMEVLPGPERRVRWGVPDGARDPTTGELVHDDLVLSAALVAVLEEQPWGIARSEVIQSVDPLAGAGEVF